MKSDRCVLKEVGEAALTCDKLLFGGFAIHDLTLQLHRSRSNSLLEDVVRLVQAPVTLLDFQEHRVKSIDEGSDLIVPELLCWGRFCCAIGHGSHRFGKAENWV